MTVTEPEATAEVLASYAAAAAEAAVDALPSGAWSVEPAAGVAGALPQAAAAVTLALAGGAQLTMLADATLARAVQVGPPPAEDVVDGLGPALGRALQALAPVVDPTGAPPAVEVAVAEVLGSPGRTTAVAMLDGGTPRAALVLQVPEPSPAAGGEGATAAHVGPAPDLGELRARPSGAGGGLELLHDVELGVTAELGRTRMLVRDVLDLVPGSVIELDRTAGSPVDVLVNGTIIARGEVVVVDEEFGIRITEILGYQD